MSEEVNDFMIKETQNALSKYVKKPPLTEKLLKKPPFRYLHDIITAVIRETGFFDGLYTADELNSNNVKDKESKIVFLDKLIFAMKKVTGKNISIRSAKIVAGLEVPKTLELLQMIGKAIDDKIDTSQIVVESQNVIDMKLQKNKKNSNEKEKRQTEITADKVLTQQKTITKEQNIAPNNKELTIKKDKKSDLTERSNKSKTETAMKNTTESTSKISKSISITNTKSKVPIKNSIMRKPGVSKSTPIRRASLKDSIRDKNNSAKPSQNVIKEESERINDNIIKKTNVTQENDTITEKKSSFEVIETPIKIEENSINDHNKEYNTNSSSKNTEEVLEQTKESDKQEKSSFKRQESTLMPRPGSARPGSRKPVHNNGQNEMTFDKNHTKNTENIDTKGNEMKSRVPSSIRPITANRPPSARPGAPRIKDRGEVSTIEEPDNTVGPINVIEEGKQDQFTDDKDSFIVIETEKIPIQSTEMIEGNESEQGQLVHQILKTQKELNESIAADNVTQQKQLKIEWEAGLQRETKIVSEEIEKICHSIQALTSAANPLGKLFDFLQEDVDEMQRELQHWKYVNEKLRKQQISELELKKTLLQPLQKELSDIENSIEEECLQIANIKISIMNNDEKILKLATNNNLKINLKPI